MDKTIRWKQRFQNLQNAFTQFQNAVLKKELSDLERSGLIQTFNFTFELCWKTLKDFLESKGLEEKFPRDVLKSSFQNGIIKEGHTWIDMLDKRNELIHLYSEDAVKKAVELIKTQYFPVINELIQELKIKNENN
jgi:nucleotidyltransferase substrate binding protein (TIGR01987 family)